LKKQIGCIDVHCTYLSIARQAQHARSCRRLINLHVQAGPSPFTNTSHCFSNPVPPDILDAESSKDITVNEGQNASLYCVASGNPQPRESLPIFHAARLSFSHILPPRTGIIWRRDDGSPIIMRASNNRSRKSDTFEGELINFLNVDRQQSGAYLCIAKNDVPPAVSKRVFLSVNCKLKAQAV